MKQNQDPLMQQHNQMAASYKKLNEARTMLDKARKELDHLTKMGDTVTQDDVIKSAGVLVAAGLTPKAVAGLIADMPEQGQALAQWVAGHDVDVTQREQHLEQTRNQVAHQVAVTGLQVLGKDHAMRMMGAGGLQGRTQQAQQSQPPSSPAGLAPNPLTNPSPMESPAPSSAQGSTALH